MGKYIIDMGHTLQGTGSGAIGIKSETDLNRLVGNRLIDMLKSKGHTVVNATVDKSNQNLVDRVKIANQHKDADLFLSLHLNAFSNPDANGVETFSYISSSEATRAIVRRIQNELVSSIGWKDRGCKTADYYVLKHTTAPSILVELGFCTNKGDMDKFNVELVAKALFKGITGLDYVTDTNKVYRVQIGAYKDIRNAQAMVDKLKALGISGIIV